MKLPVKKVQLSMLVDPAIKQRLSLAAALSGRRALSIEAEARLKQSLDADNIHMPKKTESSYAQTSHC